MGNAKSQSHTGETIPACPNPRKRPTSARSAIDTRERSRRRHWDTSSQTLQFHMIHGDNIEIHHNGKVAERVTGFCDAIAFSSRPIGTMERVTVKLRSIDNGWSGALRIGFTSVDPMLIANRIPRYACPDLTNKPGYWAKALTPSICILNNKLTFYVDMAGKLQYSVNNGRDMELVDGIDTTTSLWAIFDLYGNTKSLEIKDTDRIHSLLPSLAIDSSIHITLPTDISTKVMEKLELNERPLPARFSATMGTGLKCRNFVHVTRKEDNIDASCIAFTHTRLTAGQTAYFYCAETREHSLNRLLGDMNFGIGITTCDPAKVVISEIPQDATMLMDRPEYWVFYRDFENPDAEEYFSISVEREGLITYTRENEEKTVLFYADVYEPLYLVLDLCGSVSSLAIVGISKDLTASFNELVNDTVTNRTTQDMPTPSTSRYPHEISAYPHSRSPGTSDFANLLQPRPQSGLQSSDSVYPHDDYVPCQPITSSNVLTVDTGTSSSDEDFHDALTSNQRHITTRSEVDAVVSIPGIEVPDIVELRSSLDELWRSVMHEPPPQPSVDLPTEKKQLATSSKHHVTESKSENCPQKEPEVKKSGAKSATECIICYDLTANSVMYPCGHVCLCFDCGQAILKQRQSICPLCRALVKDVIRIYQS